MRTSSCPGALCLPTCWAHMGGTGVGRGSSVRRRQKTWPTASQQAGQASTRTPRASGSDICEGPDGSVSGGQGGLDPSLLRRCQPSSTPHPGGRRGPRHASPALPGGHRCWPGRGKGRLQSGASLLGFHPPLQDRRSLTTLPPSGSLCPPHSRAGRGLSVSGVTKLL